MTKLIVVIVLSTFMRVKKKKQPFSMVFTDLRLFNVEQAINKYNITYLYILTNLNTFQNYHYKIQATKQQLMLNMKNKMR